MISNYTEDIKSALLGLAVGDALGVPVEFLNRDYFKKNPVTDMIGYGTHNQPAGTFSDDSSLAFCLAEALTKEYDINEIADNFIRWYHEGYWAAHGEVFDIGIATREAINRLVKDMSSPEFAGGFGEYSNGNGSLMRILPLAFYIKDKPIEERWAITKQVSSITHGHIRSVIACFYYLEFARLLLKGNDIKYIYSLLKIEVVEFLKQQQINENEISRFNRLLVDDIWLLSENDIYSSGYVLHTLEASIWCLFKTNNYKDSVLKAVNLGDDTDTTAAVIGGLAGLLYGMEGIPKEWLSQLAKRDLIIDLAERLNKKTQIDSCDFIATLVYKATEEGGRKNPAKSGYRPAVKFPFDEMMTTGMQIFIDKEWVNPGETIDAAIKILGVDYFEKSLAVGMEFDAREGNVIVATGVINKILNEILLKR